mgnify:CR=1 FL=1|tara:strand:+ start:2238 stop:2699 length:462 start_codon:yes stop_codon:yes gene_type:complete
MRFARPLSTRLTGAIALHGLTDLVNVEALVAYPLALALPDRLANPAFAVASVVHFSQDVGAVASVLLHALLYFAPSNWSMVVLDVYFATIHIPLLFCRLDLKSRLLLCFVLVVGGVAHTSVCRWLMLLRRGVLVLGPAQLKVIVAHCLATGLY